MRFARWLLVAFGVLPAAAAAFDYVDYNDHTERLFAAEVAMVGASTVISGVNVGHVAHHERSTLWGLLGLGIGAVTVSLSTADAQIPVFDALAGTAAVLSGVAQFPRYEAETDRRGAMRYFALQPEVRGLRFRLRF